MLFLNPPYFVVNGVSVFPDDSDPLQFYYLPMMPQFTMVAGAGGVSLPQLQLIEYTGAAGTGGFLNFDVNLGIADQVLNQVAQQVQQQMKLTGQVKLSPVMFVGGTVQLELLGAQTVLPAPATGPGAPSAPAGPATTTTTAAAAPGAPQFVVNIEGSSVPALYGNNQATFSVQLDQNGATILQQALQGQMAPIGVVYSLDFLGLRPAFNVRITADWNRVQTYLDQSYHAGILFFSSDIENTVDKLIESQIINIDVSSYDTDAGLGTSATSDRDQAVAECYELVKTNFFQSSLPPPTPGQPDGWDKAGQLINQVSDIALTGGASALACFSYKSVNLSRTDQKSLNFDLSERTTVQRTIYPQGHLSGLFSALTQSGVNLSQFVTQVDLDNPYFERRQVNVTTNADFATDSIGSINVDLTYNNIVQSVTLTAAAPQASVSWASLLVKGQMSTPVSYVYTVYFKDVDTTQRPGQLSSATYTANGNVDIEPRGQLYDVTVIPVQAFGLPWDRYTSVEVECQYVDAANAINQQPSAVLNSQNTAINWSLFLINPELRSFNYRLTYALATGGTSVSEWISTNEATINISDPFPDKVGLTVLAALDWTQFSQALVFLAYPSKASPAAQQTYTLTQSNPTSPAFEAERQNSSQVFVYYEAQLVMLNGTVWSVPGSVTSSAYLILQNGMKGHQIVVVQAAAAPTFAACKVTEIDVQVSYADPANSINVSQTFTLSSQGDTFNFAYDYLNPQISAQYSATIKLNNGQTKSVALTPVSGNAVVIPLSQLT
ncbi:MAG TPA: hypothetical protein VK914_02165 [bacterium]|jgi:hypothetical protein|nr:hypothetical protein [bacterium]